MHIDAASGGFVFPFSHPDFKWDFRLESVKSINTSGHKFGLVYPGVGWLILRDDEQIPEDIIFYEDYLGEKDSTFTLNFSCSASFVLAQYYMFIREGYAGYASLVRAMTENRDALSDRLSQIDALTILTSERPILPLMICKVNDDEGFTGTDLVGELARRNAWLVPAYKMPPKNDNQQILRMLIKINQTRELSDALADDFEDSVKFLRDKAAAGDLSGPKPAPHTGHGY
jgi:glutamate decarboxylase